VELRDILAMLRNHWVGIALLTLVGLAMATFMALTAEPEYRSSNSVLVTVVTGDSIADLNQGSSFVSRQVKTYAEVARSPRVLEPVVQQLGLRDSARALRSDVQASVLGEVQIIEITVTRNDAREAAAIADAVADRLASVVEELSPARADGTPSVQIDSIAPAVVPTVPASPNLRRNLALGLVVGIVLGFGWAALRTTLDTRVRTEDDARAILDTPLLATVGHDQAASGKVPQVLAPPLTVRAEEYRQLRTSLQFVDAAHRPRSFVVTSSRGGEGKSVTALNLAHAMARSDRRVCLVDADLRRPSVARYLNIEGAVGLTTVLIGRATIDDVLQPVGADGLMVLPAGRTPPNASELLGSAAMHDLVDALEERFDTVIFDCAPLLPVTDAAVLSRATDGVLLVVGSGIVNRDQLGETATKLETVGARVLGFVLNRTRRGREVHAYGYHPHAVDLDAGETAVRQGADADHAAPAGTDPDQPVPARTELPGTTVEGTGENPEESTPPAEATPLDDAQATPPEKGTTNDALPSPPEPERATTPGVPSSG